ncbi:MAG: DUF2335 domain-containing protein [Alphaproteobacteria bacterium GM7ARS4]|nr:DUF2335 domain-containing protein [Alphaproteobacteria bacterium GM7ARS4]
MMAQKKDKTQEDANALPAEGKSSSLVKKGAEKEDTNTLPAKGKSSSLVKKEGGMVVEGGEVLKRVSFVLSEEHSTWRTSLPPSKEMTGYEETLKGAANRIVAMAEDNARHRRGMGQGLLVIVFIIVGVLAGAVSYAFF